MKMNPNSFYVFGVNTDLGKTLFSAGIIKSAIKKNLSTHYIKPVQTGGMEAGDENFIRHFVSSSLFSAETISCFSTAVSPHRARKLENEIAENHSKLTDSAILESLKRKLSLQTSQFLLIEGAGGVASPTIDGQLQCDFYRNILLPVVLVADSRLGGISSSIAGIELLHSRGYEVCCVLLFAGEHENAEFLQRQFPNIQVLCFQNLSENENLLLWYETQIDEFDKVTKIMLQFLQDKIKRKQEALQIAKDHVWWPFTQHSLIEKVNYLDSAYGDSFSMFSDAAEENSYQNVDCYDGSASWWTQGLGHGNPKLMKAAAFAAGRYGHVMFPGNIHEPAALLVKKLLETVGKGWANRVFFSDNGSTANEVALKMAFRKRFGKTKLKSQPVVIGLLDSYHGDTHATMDATNPNVFKDFDHWYNPRGYWLSYPKLYMKNEKYVLELPSDFQPFFQDSIQAKNEFDCEFKNFFSLERNKSSFAKLYSDYVNFHLEHLFSQNSSIGACILEGVLMGSGGMQLVDPLFQRVLIQACQQRKIPVILDEVFTGFWRLGCVSAAEMLHVKPDIACYGKLLTGGLLPMSVTLATEEVFHDFLGENKSDALLHGHSYTAHPIGCHVSQKALDEIQQSLFYDKETSKMKDFWNKDIIKKISNLKSIARVFSIGTVFAIELNDTNSGYQSNSSQKLICLLKENNIEARPLGNVVYVISGFFSEKSKLNEILKLFLIMEM